MLFKGFRTVKESLTFLSLPVFAFHSWEKNLRALNKFKYESQKMALKISCEGTLCIWTPQRKLKSRENVELKLQYIKFLHVFIYIYFNQRTQCLTAFNGTFVCVKTEEQSSVSPWLCALSAISSPQIFTPNCGRTSVSQSSWACVGWERSPLCGTTSAKIPALLKSEAKLLQKSLLPTARHTWPPCWLP